MNTPYPTYLHPVETLPRAQLSVLQEARLLDTIHRAYHQSPLLREIWQKAGVHPDDIRSTADFQAMAPFFNQDSIRHYRDSHADPFGGLIRPDNPYVTSLATTSGTTGDPSPMPMRHHFTTHEGYLRDYWHMGGRPGDYIFMILFTFRGGPLLCLPGQQKAGLIPVYFNHSPAEIPRLIEGLKRYRPTLLSMVSSPLLLAFEQYFESHDENPREVFASVKGSIYGGEALSPRLKSLADAWGLPLNETSALGDVVSGTECNSHSGFHAWEDLAFVECLDLVTDRPVADGEVGELVVTSIRDPLLTMVRFRTDDLAVLNRQPCSCGRTHLRYQILGRKGDQLQVQGKTVLPRDIRFLIEAEHETAAGLFQIVKTAPHMDSLRVRVGYNPLRLQTSTEALAAHLQQLLETALDMPVLIELVLNDDLLKLGPPHKIPRVTKS